jgi:MFS family permease
VGSAYLSDRFTQRRATALSWHTAGGSLGTVVVPVLMSAAIAAAGWRWALVALGVALCAGGLLVPAALPADPAPAGSPGGGRYCRSSSRACKATVECANAPLAVSRRRPRSPTGPSARRGSRQSGERGYDPPPGPAAVVSRSSR